MELPLSNIIEKIKKETNMSEKEVYTKIDSKMDELAGLVSKEGAAHIIANELNIKLNEISQDFKINEIKPFLKNFKVVGKVTNVFDLIEFERNSILGKVKSLILGDMTGRVRISFWNSAAETVKDIKVNDILRVGNCSSKENLGRVEISVSSENEIEINPQGVVINVVQANVSEPNIKKIVELKEDSYGCILGSVVQVFKPSFFYSCPECRKRLVEEKGVYSCKEHGVVEKKLSYVLNAFVDDGTDVMRVVFFNEQAEILTDYDSNKFEELFNDDKLLDKLKQSLNGKLVKVSGSIRFSSFSNKNELIANKVTIDIDPEKELQNMN